MTAPDEERAPRRVALGLLAAVAVAALVTLTVAVHARSGWLFDVDHRTAADLNRYIVSRHDQLDVWKVITNVGGPTVCRIGALVAAIVLFVRRRRGTALFVAVSIAGTAALSTLGKDLVGRARPHVPHPVATAAGASYPSGHALTSIVAVGVVLVLARPIGNGARRAALTGAGALVVALVGFSRLILGVHYVSDIVAGWLLGALWLWCAALVLRPGRRLCRSYGSE